MVFFILNDDVNAYNDPGQYTYGGAPSWVYYLCGGIFVVLTLLCAWYTWRVRDSKNKYAHLMDTFNEFKKFWYTHRFSIMIFVTIVMLVCAIVFFTMNNTLASQVATSAAT